MSDDDGDNDSDGESSVETVTEFITGPSGGKDTIEFERRKLIENSLYLITKIELDISGGSISLLDIYGRTINYVCDTKQTEVKHIFNTFKQSYLIDPSYEDNIYKIRKKQEEIERLYRILYRNPFT